MKANNISLDKLIGELDQLYVESYHATDDKLRTWMRHEFTQRDLARIRLRLERARQTTEAMSLVEIFSLVQSRPTSIEAKNLTSRRPPFNAEYVLYLLLRKKDREVLIGDLIEEYAEVVRRFNKRRADIWFYKQVAGSLLPLLRRALLRIGALIWLGRILRRLIS